MTWKLVYSNRAQKSIRRLDSVTSRRIVAGLERFTATGHGDVARVRGNSARWRLRIGSWRVFFIYDAMERAILVLDVLHRRDAYRGTD
ncbi:MAG: type II toxin-antitoxin system RelE/ParE family toxin [Dehalococcoidia bacterium]|nr:type II toxin-antitoxin system RelE/ParE family toxin [Dehalococcoidia bacterium]